MREPKRRGAAHEGGELSLRAPAKLNLHLAVLGRRPDGFHEIDTVMRTVDLSDTLRLRSRADGDLTLEVSGLTEGVPVGRDNIVLAAAEALRREFAPEAGPAPGADIHLEKRIPTGGGLGGGSSDAAAALVGLSRLWGLRADEEALLRTAASLGSDVPFLIRGGTARCGGRGEVVRPFHLAGFKHFVLVLGRPLVTAEAYKIFSRICLTEGYAQRTFDGRSNASGAGLLLEEQPLRNDLEAAAFELRPPLRMVKERLLAAGASHAALSGSGSTVFGVATSAAEAARIAQEVRSPERETITATATGPRENLGLEESGGGNRRPYQAG